MTFSASNHSQREKEKIETVHKQKMDDKVNGEINFTIDGS